MLVYVEGENRKIRRKTLAERREPTTNSAHIWHGARIEPRPYWGRRVPLATAPTLPPNIDPRGLLLLLDQ